MSRQLVTRRRFLLASAAAAAAACTRTPRLIGSTPVAPRPTIPSGLQPTAGDRLQLLTWDQYLWKYVLDEFSHTFGVTYDIATFNNPEEGMQRLTDGFDVYVADVQDLPTLVSRGDLQPLNTSYLGHVGDAWPEVRATLDPYAAYTVPYALTPLGVSWLPSLVHDPSLTHDPYGAFWDPKFAHMTSFSSDPTALAVALIRIGADPNTEDPDVLARAGEELKASNASIANKRAAIWLDPSTRAITDSYGGYLYPTPGRDQAMHARFSIPASNAIVWMDTFVVPKSSRNPVLAHLFMNFMLRPKIALANAEWVGTTTPVTGADPTGSSAAYAMTREQFATAHPLLPLSAEGRTARDAVWNDVRATLEARS